MSSIHIALFLCVLCTSMALVFAADTIYLTTVKPPTYFASISTTGKVTKLVQFDDELNGMVYAAALNKVTSKYAWFVFAPDANKEYTMKLCTVDLNTLTYSLSPAIWNVMSPLSITWDSQRNMLYQISFSGDKKRDKRAPGEQRQIVSTDPTTWNQTIVYDYGNIFNTTYITSALDAENLIYYLCIAELVGPKRVLVEYVDTVNLRQATRTRVTLSFGSGIQDYPSSWEFDDVSGTIIGVVYYPKSNQYGMASVNPNSGVISQAKNPQFYSQTWNVGTTLPTFSSASEVYYKTFFYGQFSTQLLGLDPTGMVVRNHSVPVQLSTIGVL